MSKYLIIEQEVNSLLKELINEEYGISLEIENKTKEIMNQIKECIKNNSNIDTSKDCFGNIIKKGYINISLNNFETKLYFKVYNFLTEERYDKYASLYNYTSKFDNITNEISIVSAMFNGKFINETFGSAIQHEISHFFDKTHYNCVVPDKELLLYNITREILFSSLSKEAKILALCVYVSFKSEQIAFANSLDNMFSYGKITEDDAKQMDEYKYLLILSDTIKDFNKKYAQMCYPLFKKTKKFIYRRIVDGYYNYARRISRIFMKHKKYENKNCFITEHILNPNKKFLV